MKNLLALIALVVASVSISHAADFTPLKDGDRVVFYGDSITQQRQYTTYLEEYVHCRYPNLHVTFFNAGWSGDTAAGALARVDRDVTPLKPTVVTIFFGMNDGHYQPPDDATNAQYHDSMDKLVAKLQSIGARVIVFGPGCVDEDKQAHLKDVDYNKTLSGLSEIARQIAAAHDCVFVDVYTPMLKFLNEQKAKTPGFSMSGDGIHPTVPGHLVMCRQMVTALAEPAGTIETGKPAPPTSADTPYTMTTRPIPFWVPRDAEDVARDCGMLQYAAGKLAVPALPEGNYLVSIDDSTAGSVTALQLATGMPISAPSSIRGQQLHDLIAAKEENYFAAWRNIQLPMGDRPSVQAVYAAMMKTDDALNAAIEDLLTNTQSTITVVAQPLGQDLALNKPYTCSDPNVWGWNPGLTDGSWAAVVGHCFATSNTQHFPKWVTIDLGSSQPIGAVVVGVPPFGSTKTISISVSDDNKAFKEIGSHVFAQRQAKQFVYAASNDTHGRYVRLTYPDHYEESADFDPSFAFTTEAEVYAKAAPR
jgi:lysophospholipase L1-like esterase